MTSPNLADALANANTNAVPPEEAETPSTEVAPTDELSSDDLSLVSGGLVDASGDCKAMACGVY